MKDRQLLYYYCSNYYYYYLMLMLIYISTCCSKSQNHEYNYVINDLKGNKSYLCICCVLLC